jgi:hypothetical protein
VENSILRYYGGKWCDSEFFQKERRVKRGQKQRKIEMARRHYSIIFVVIVPPSNPTSIIFHAALVDVDHS